MDKNLERVYRMSFASVYPLYITKVERKGRTREDVDTVVQWLTGYSAEQMQQAIADEVDFETFFTQAPAPNTARSLITGTICGVKVQEIEDPIMREVRYLDKLVDEVAKGKAMERVLRTAP